MPLDVEVLRVIGPGCLQRLHRESNPQVDNRRIKNNTLMSLTGVSPELGCPNARADTHTHTHTHGRAHTHTHTRRATGADSERELQREREMQRRRDIEMETEKRTRKTISRHRDVPTEVRTRFSEAAPNPNH